MKPLKHILPLLWAMSFTWLACHKEEIPVPLSERVQGAWKQVSTPHSVYVFTNTTCENIVKFNGAELYRNEYHYTCDGDTMRLADLIDDSTETWVFDFPTDSTATINVVGFPLNITIKRYP